MIEAISYLPHNFKASLQQNYHLVPEKPIAMMAQMARPKRPFSSLAMGDELSDLSQFPTTNIDSNTIPYFVGLHGQVLDDSFGSGNASFAVTNKSLFSLPSIPEVDQYNAFPNSGFSDNYAASVPFMPFSSELCPEFSSHSNIFPAFGPMTSQFMYLQQDSFQSDHYQSDSFQSLGAQEPSQSAAMNPSLHPPPNQPHKSRSVTSMEGRSIHGRSVGSEYVIDSPYEYAHGGVTTPGTAQSYEFVERPMEAARSPGGILTHENDLIGLEINPSLANAPFGTRTTREVYSRSPQGIHLDGMDPTTGQPTFTFNGLPGSWQDSNSPPWVPLSSDQLPTHDPAQFWDDYSFLPTAALSFPLESSATPAHANLYPDSTRETSNIREASHDDSVTQAQGTNSESNSPSSSDRPSVGKKRKAAGRRTGPLPETVKGGAKSTRKVHACWCCRMRKVTCNPDKDHDCPECLRFWQRRMQGPFLTKDICFRNPLEEFQPLFIPNFMIEQFNSPAMNSFTKDLVAENGWLDRGKTEVRLLCGFGPPLIVKDIQEFRPNGVVQIFSWRRDNPNLIGTAQTLPIGMSQATAWMEGDALDDLDQHLNQIIDSREDLHEFVQRVIRSRNFSRSSKTLKVVLEWYQEWKDEESMSRKAEVLLRNAIKVIMITTIFGRRLILAEIPQEFNKFFNEAPYTANKYERHRQCPRLINRQVKAALWLLQQKLLREVLRDFGRELTHADGWPICFAVAIILAFSLETIREKSVGFYRLDKACDNLRMDKESVRCLGSDNAIHQYRTVALVKVFDVIHVLMRCKSEKQTPSDRKNAKRITSMGSSLRKVINDMKERFEDEEPGAFQPMQDVGEDPCRLVSALLELIR